MARMFKEEALRVRLHAFFAEHTERGSLPEAVLKLLKFDFGWSYFGTTAKSHDSLSCAVLDGAALNEVDLTTNEGLSKLAAFVDGADAPLFARSCAAPMSRPMVREESYRSMFTWLQHNASAETFAAHHYDAIEQLVLAALTDTWSAVRKASARALGSALVPLSSTQIHNLHLSILDLRLSLPAGRPDASDVATTSSNQGAVGRAHVSGSPPSASAFTESPPAPASLVPSTRKDLHTEVDSAYAEQNAWKAHEGLLLGTAALLRFLASRVASGLDLTTELSQLACMCSSVRPTLFPMLAHVQITVRETAQDTFLATLIAPQTPKGAEARAHSQQHDGVARASTPPEDLATLNFPEFAQRASDRGHHASDAACMAFAEVITRLDYARSALNPGMLQDTGSLTVDRSTGMDNHGQQEPIAIAPCEISGTESKLRASLPPHLRQALHLNRAAINESAANSLVSTSIVELSAAHAPDSGQLVTHQTNQLDSPPFLCLHPTALKGLSFVQDSASEISETDRLAQVPNSQGKVLHGAARRCGREDFSMKRTSEDPSARQLLPAAEAEGLLGLAVALIPLLPPQFVIRNWPAYWSVLDAYLAHNASTVRQTCSSFFQKLLDAAPVELRCALLRLCLQSLGAGWHIDINMLTNLNPATPPLYQGAPSGSATSLCDDQINASSIEVPGEISSLLAKPLTSEDTASGANKHPFLSDILSNLIFLVSRQELLKYPSPLRTNPESALVSLRPYCRRTRLDSGNGVRGGCLRLNLFTTFCFRSIQQRWGLRVGLLNTA